MLTSREQSPFTAHNKACAQHYVKGRVSGSCDQPKKIAYPPLQLHIIDINTFLADIKKEAIENDKRRVFKLANRIGKLCDDLINKEINNECVDALLDLADIVLECGKVREAYTLYHKAIEVSKLHNGDPELVQDAWLGIAKLLKVGDITSVSEEKAVGDQIFNWLVTSYDSEEARTFLF